MMLLDSLISVAHILRASEPGLPTYPSSEPFDKLRRVEKEKLGSRFASPKSKSSLEQY